MILLKKIIFFQFCQSNLATRIHAKQIAESIKILEMIWGELGYIYANIDPSMLPNEETKTVDIAFHSELGSKVFLNKINIIGNSKTRDKSYSSSPSA